MWYVSKICQNLFSVLATRDTDMLIIALNQLQTATKGSLKIHNTCFLHGIRSKSRWLLKGNMRVCLPKESTAVHLTTSGDSLLQLSGLEFFKVVLIANFLISTIYNLLRLHLCMKLISEIRPAEFFEKQLGSIFQKVIYIICEVILDYLNFPKRQQMKINICTMSKA